MVCAGCVTDDRRELVKHQINFDFYLLTFNAGISRCENDE